MAFANDSKITAKTRSRRWCFTSFDEKAPVDDGTIQYMCYQRERCPTTGREHWQGYVEFDGKGGIGIAGVKKRLGIGCDLRKSRGTAQQNRVYCSKMDSAIAGTFKEIGEPGIQGDRTDIKEVHTLVLDGWTDREIALEHPKEYMHLHRHIGALRKTIMPIRDPVNGAMPKGIILWGPTGSGKSHWVYSKYNAKDVFSKNNSKWWNGYTGQRVVVINEFKFTKDIDQDYLKNLCDKYPFMVEDKGGMLDCSVDTVILTMNHNPKTLNIEPALLRRFEITEFKRGTEKLSPDEVDDLWAEMGM